MLDAQVHPIEYRTAMELVVAHHYLHRKAPVSFAYGLYDTTLPMGLPMGVVTYGVPASRHLQKSACPADPGAVLELNRLWLDDALPRNTASWFVSRTLRRLPPRIIVSYADPVHGHYGYVYRAMGFHYAGWTDMDRKTPRLDYIPLAAGHHSREATRTGYSGIVRRIPKVKYWTVSGATRTQRRALERACGWPQLNWNTQPPPGPPGMLARKAAA